MEERELKECPFCGSIDTDVDYWSIAGHREYSVVCNNCSAAGPFDLTENQAIKIWNLRRPMDKMLALLDEKTTLDDALNDTLKVIFGPRPEDFTRQSP